MSSASPSARSVLTSNSTISENTPDSMSANAQVDPTKPHPIMATFRSLSLAGIAVPPFFVVRAKDKSRDADLSFNICSVNQMFT